MRNREEVVMSSWRRLVPVGILVAFTALVVERGTRTLMHWVSWIMIPVGLGLVALGALTLVGPSTACCDLVLARCDRGLVMLPPAWPSTTSRLKLVR